VTEVPSPSNAARAAAAAKAQRVKAANAAKAAEDQGHDGNHQHDESEAALHSETKRLSHQGGEDSDGQKSGNDSDFGVSDRQLKGRKQSAGSHGYEAVIQEYEREQELENLAFTRGMDDEEAGWEEFSDLYGGSQCSPLSTVGGEMTPCTPAPQAGQHPTDVEAEDDSSPVPVKNLDAEDLSDIDVKRPSAHHPAGSGGSSTR